MPKLERFVLECEGFLSIIPPRIEDDKLSFSKYIELEVSLARRAAIPFLIFVDDRVLSTYSGRFPKNAIPFVSDAPQRDRIFHEREVKKFLSSIENYSRNISYIPRQAAIIHINRSFEATAASIHCILGEGGYNSAIIPIESSSDVIDNIALLEKIYECELCVLIGHKDLHAVDLALSLTYAAFKPTIRLRYDPVVVDCISAISGDIYWSNEQKLLSEFRTQFQSYRANYLDLTDNPSGESALANAASMNWEAEQERYWLPNDPLGLLQHIDPDNSLLGDHKVAAQTTLRIPLRPGLNSEECYRIVETFYNKLRRWSVMYTIEPATTRLDAQKIRTPHNINIHRSATCIDMACMFAAYMESCYMYPIVVIVESANFIHSVVGFRTSASALSLESSIGDIRRELDEGGLILLEPTGPIFSDTPVAFELRGERESESHQLPFNLAIEASKRLLYDKSVSIKYVIDVRTLRVSK